MASSNKRFEQLLNSVLARYEELLYGFSKFSILIGWQAVRKNPYPDRGLSVSGPVSRMSFIWREIFALQTEKNFAF
jgi:hypothetical protein